VILPAKTKYLLLSVLLVALPAHRALALLNLDGTRNQVFVFGSVSFAYNSNIFSESTSRGDYSVTGEAGIELKRRAGIIAINCTVKLAYQRYNTYTGENALNPNFYIEFAKTTGRTTGSLTINAYRESRSDSAVNILTHSWNIPVGLSIKYPLNDKFYVTSSTSYLERRYIANAALANYRDYTESADVFYVYTSKLDLDGGYRIRLSKTSIGRDTYDHWFNFGATGGLMAKLNGSIRFGYQIREINGGEKFNHFNALAALNWPVTRKLTFSSQASRDFNTIATGASVDSTSLALRANYVFTRKADMEGGVSYGRNLFLGGLPPQRYDHFIGWDISGGYKLNDHLRLAATYNYLQNWSTLNFSEFTRHGFSLDIASRF
jgi:hypothetical protein